LVEAYYSFICSVERLISSISAFLCMKSEEKGLDMLKRESASSMFSGILWNIFSEIIREGKFPQLFRDTIQFYLKNVAMFKARVLDNNRITIPKEEVEILGVKPGDYVAVILTKIEGRGGEQ